jgi:M6 family metalloprotease-like protein
MKTRATLLGALLPILVVGSSALAMPASPRPFEVTQPDGTRIKLYLRGDETYHWLEDANHFTVLRDQDRFVYARKKTDGTLAATDMLVGKSNPASAGLVARLRSDAAVVKQFRADRPTAVRRGGDPLRVPPVGNVKNLVVMIRFANHTGRTLPSAADVDTLFNAVGGDPTLAPTGSVRDVYFENSYGTMTLQSTVVAWVDVPGTEAYYANGDSGDQTLWEALTYALTQVDTLIDFSQFDEDSDGAIDAISFLHSGYGAEWGDYDIDGAYYTDRIWSHRWTIMPAWTSAEGVSVSDYHISPALWDVSGSAIGRIAVICHETGHFFGLPDLYDTQGDGQGVGSYALMSNSWGFDYSQLYPPHFCAWSKIFLGWVTPTIISAPGTYTAPQAATNPTVFRIDQGYPAGEYLLIENRQPYGFDGIIPQGGLAIWHVDENKGTFDYNDVNGYAGYPGQLGWPENDRHYRVALLQADGTFEFERGWHRGQGDELYHAGGVSEITETTLPNTDAYQNGDVYQTHNAITNISASGSSMTFTFGQWSDCNFNGVGDDQDIAMLTSLDCNNNGVPDECDMATEYRVLSPRLAPFDASTPQSYTLVAPPLALADVTLNVEAGGDLSASFEYADVFLNGTYVGTMYFNGGSDCPDPPVGERLMLPASLFNAAATSGAVSINLVASAEVTPGVCSDPFVQVLVSYPTVTDSCNGNGVPDDCDIAAGTSEDCNVNDVPDSCEFGGTTTALRQAPDNSAAFWSESACTSCDTGAQILADDFSLSTPQMVTGIKLWGTYTPTDTPSADDFTIVIHAADNGLPGTSLATFTGISGIRTATGQLVFGNTEYMYELPLPAPVALPAGSYFVEAYNHTTGTSDEFNWETGLRLSGDGDGGFAYAFEAPGLAWGFYEGADLALEVIADPSSPDCNLNQVPDTCEPDCNANGYPDDCDIAAGTSVDNDGNGLPDECGECVADGECDNGLYCDGQETCELNSCVAGSAPTVDDGIDCTVDACDEDLDQVTHTPVDGVCDNGQFCDGAEVCNAVSGCEPGPAPALDDGINCTVDDCDEDLDEVTHTPNDAACDNGLFCDGAETCGVVSGCEAGIAPATDDGIDCTVDECDEDLDQVTHTPDHAACDNDLFCDGIETCSTVLGCQAGAAPVIDDGIDCTFDECDEILDQVIHTPDDLVCDNDLFCDGEETCDPNAGCVAGIAPVLDDGIDCTVDMCDDGLDIVTHTPDDTVCDNLLFCDGVEVCDVVQGCLAGVDPCPGELCVEQTQQCAPDCNNNAVPDADDIAAQSSLDCNATDIPDECEVMPAGDHNADGVVDAGDVAGVRRLFRRPGWGPNPASPACLQTCLDVFDQDFDGDIDLMDYAKLVELVVTP